MFRFPLDNFARTESFCTHNPARTSSTPQTVTSLGAPKIQRWIIEPQYVLVHVCLRVWGHAHQHAFVCMQKPKDNFEGHPQGHHLPPLLQDWSLSWSLLISLVWLTRQSQGPSSCYFPVLRLQCMTFPHGFWGLDSVLYAQEAHTLQTYIPTPPAARYYRKERNQPFPLEVDSALSSPRTLSLKATP